MISGSQGKGVTGFGVNPVPALSMDVAAAPSVALQGAQIAAGLSPDGGAAQSQKLIAGPKDAYVVLGGGINPDGTLKIDCGQRADYAASLAKQVMKTSPGKEPYFIFSGQYGRSDVTDFGDTILNSSIFTILFGKN